MLNYFLHINQTDLEGDTALIGASLNGRKEVVELLIAHGEDVNHANQSADTALINASNNGHTEIAELLCKHGAV